MGTTDVSLIDMEDPVLDALTQALEVTPIPRSIVDDSILPTPNQEKFHNNHNDDDKFTSKTRNLEANDDMKP